MLGIRRVVGTLCAAFRAIQRVWFSLLLAVLVVALPGAASAYLAGAALALELPPEGHPPVPVTAETRAKTAIVINVPAFRLELYAGEQFVRAYPIAVGSMVTQTVLGQASIISRVVDPTWYPEGRPPVPPGPDNPVGTRWLGLSVEGFGIHGTNAPDSIGKPVSSGCIRLKNADVEELYDLVRIGTPVFFTYETIFVFPEPSGRSVYITVYPDIYKRGTNSRGHLAARLEAAGIRIAPKVGTLGVDDVLREAGGWPRRFPVAVDIFVGGHKVPGAMGIWLGEELWLPAALVAPLMGAAVQWGSVPGGNEKAALIYPRDARAGQRHVVVLAREKARIIDGRLYLRLEDLGSVLRVRTSFSETERAAYFHLPLPGHLVEE